VIRVRDVCSRLTRKSRSNFYYAFLALPRARRQALYAVYAFCRTVDDIADQEGPGDTAARRRELDEWRAEIGRCYEAGGEPRHPIARRLASAVRGYPVPRDALEAIVDGVEMDLDGRAYETEEDLYPYCYRVASAVGLCCIEIFGAAEPGARPYAVNLGIALQLTNIIRDVGADMRGGRIYLPREDLRKFGVTVDDLRAGRHTREFVLLMEHEAERARRYYRAAREAYPVNDARALVPAEIMGQIYRALLDEVEARDFRVFGERITVPTRRKVAIALRCWAAARFGARRPADGRAA
jgi:15-cis-phytoene synthase